MEFLDIILTKNSSLLFHAIHSPFYWLILKKTILFSGFKNPYKQENSRLFIKSILKDRKIRVESQTKTQVLRRLEFMPRKLDLKCRSRIPSLVSFLSV
jgi:hypothetical protein